MDGETRARSAIASKTILALAGVASQGVGTIGFGDATARVIAFVHICFTVSSFPPRCALALEFCCR